MAKAAVTRSIRDDHQKNFLKIFNSLTGKHSRWEIWEDFVTLTAIEISNSTDKVNAPERTKMYQTIVSKYSAKERDGMVEMLAEVIMGMEQNPDQDFLGSLYMMCELGNDHAGQFFTPYDVCRCMAEITFDPKLHPDMEGFISVSDPACGAGAMQDALEQQKWQHQKAEWVEQLKKFATEDSQASYQTHEHVNAYGKWDTKKEVVMPEDADKIAYVYKVSENQIDLYKPRDTEAEDASNSAREAARATEQLAREQFAAVTKLMYELRWDFVKDLTPAECKKHLPEILAYSTPILTEYRHMEDDENVLRLLGIGLDEQIREDTELEDALKMFNAYDTEPEKILLAAAFDATDGSREGYWSTEWNGPTGASKFVHRKNDDLDSTYELLTALGYEMADDEKALQDGTHQLFAVYGSGSKADTPCDKCKAAHPECDKCCKTCDDHCNAFQLCRKEYGE